MNKDPKGKKGSRAKTPGPGAKKEGVVKVVVNRCHGGFSLSKKAVARLAELRGKTAYFFKLKVGPGDKYAPLSVDSEDGLFWTAFSIPNPNEYFAEEKSWYEMTMEERKASNEKYSAVDLEARPEDRADPLLVQVVEELGKEANGTCAELEIVEIPEGVEWHIQDYDGMEAIHEEHRSW